MDVKTDASAESIRTLDDRARVTGDANSQRAAVINDAPRTGDDGDGPGEVDAERPVTLAPSRENDGVMRGLDHRGANLASALRLASAGVPVFPVRVSKGSRGEWRKQPDIKDWQRAASTDAAIVERWWREFPDAVPGIALGRCGLVVIDPDRHQGAADGVAAFADLVRRNGGLLPHPVTHTAGGGEHHVFRQREGEPLGNRTGSLPEGICVRGDGGFVVAPGAVRPDGAAWRADGDAPDLADAFNKGAIPVMPEWLVEIIRGGAHATAEHKSESATGNRERMFAAAALAGCAAELEQSVHGNRNNTLNAVSYRLGRMAARGWVDDHLVLDALAGSAARCGLVDDDGDEAVRATIMSGLDAGRTAPHPDLADRAAQAGNGVAAVDGHSPPTVPVTWDGDAEPNPPAWLVKDLIPLGAVGFLVGESRAGKSFLAVHLAAALGRGEPFFTKRARRGGTLYVAAEAARTIPGRLKAARLGPVAAFLDENGRNKEDGTEPLKLPVAVVPGGIDLLTESGVNEFVRVARGVSGEMVKRAGVPLRLIGIDTTLAQFPIGNWNDPAEVTRVTNVMARIARETGATVLGVHHHGKDISRGPAGSYALTAAADFIISVLCDGDIEGNVTGRRIALTKQREGETGWGCEFTLRPFKIGTDEYGEDVVCAFVEPEEITAGFGKTKKNKNRPQSRSSSAFMDALSAALDRHGEDHAAGGGALARAVGIHHVRDAFADKYEPASSPGSSAEEATRKAFGRALREALEAGAVTETKHGGAHWLTRTENG